MRRSLRSRSLRRTKKKVPGGRLALKFSRKKPKAAKCGKCGKPLSGVPRMRPAQLNKLAKTEKRPERPYGGHLCTECSRKIFRMKVTG
jgi:large subunit ribosomal protein L34e